MGKVCCTDSTDYEKKWRIEADLDALCRAKAVEKDPERMAACKKLAKTKLADSKQRRDEMQMMIDMGEGKNP